MAYDENIYAKFMSGTLTTQEISTLKETGEWEDLAKIKADSEHLSLPSFDKEKGFEQLVAARKQSQQSTGVVRKLWPALAAAAGIALLLGFLFLFNGADTTIQAELANTESHILPDKSTVLLNDGSNIKYANKSFATDRTLTLVGEAFFTVEKGSSFTVKTDYGSVQVLGTSFNVRSWDSNLIVECYSGRVNVSSNNANEILGKGEKLRIINGNKLNKEMISHTNPEWMNGQSKFKNESIFHVFSELERQYDVRLHHSISDRIFNGAFTHQGLTQALENICQPMGLTFNIKNQNQVEITE